MMLERHGAVLTDGSTRGGGLSALHNDARADVLAAELGALARKAGKEATPYKLARDWAARTIAAKPVGEISDLVANIRGPNRGRGSVKRWRPRPRATPTKRCAASRSR